jgi:PAS domain S-box-containing protein
VLELEMKCRDGSTVWTEIHATFLRNSEGRPSGVIGVTRNISERKHAEEQLRESEEKYRLITETANEGIYQVDCSGKFVFTNKAYAQMLGYEPGEILGKHYSVVVPDLYLSEVVEIAESVLSGTPQKGEFTMKHKSGKKFSAYYSMVPNKKQGEIVGFSGIMEDISELKQTEKLVQSLIHQLIRSQENERQMISRELHDTVAQDLSSSKIDCEMLLKYNSITTGTRKKISQLSNNIEKIMKSVRDLSYELRPPGLEKFGLVQTVYQFCKDFSEKTDIRVDFQSAGMDSLNLDYNTKINLYRLLQEGLNNVKKHADAKIVSVRLVSSFPNIILRINDDGKGFDLKARLAKAYKEKRMGLRSMHERVGLLQGKINIESSVGRGTKVVIEIPQTE